MKKYLGVLSPQKLRKTYLVSVGLGLATMLIGCGSQQAQLYEATAETTLTWRVNYTHDPLEDKRGRYETFESVSLVNRNGEKPEEAVFQDDKGIWWPKNPPKPTVDELEAAKKKPYEKIGKPQLLRKVEYRVEYDQDGERVNLPTNYSVYRQVVKAYPDTPLSFTMGLNNGSVEKATPIAN
ncbi:hypothetical protein [Pleurocapsa sp. PCC 7319]|uniref:hypothetical protein n=1 Tax=Pleurocapsa sp. PCC 7319 TaxID=118161 RepID=UPI000347761F|nr:hypothetical protein [Pleurocapsa sp. PCC 7319]